MDGWDQYYECVDRELGRQMERHLRLFRESLEWWLYAELNWPSRDWEVQLQYLVDHTRYYGLEIHPVSIQSLHDLVEARINGTGPFEVLGPYGWDEPAVATGEPIQLALTVGLDDGTQTDATVALAADPTPITKDRVEVAGLGPGTTNSPREPGRAGLTELSDRFKSDEWTEDKALAALRRLQAIWLEEGFALAPTLLAMFLAKEKGRDFSEYAPAVRDHQVFKDAVRSHVKDVAETVRYKPGTHQIGVGAFDAEWLPIIRTNWLSTTSAGEVAYAIGTGHFRYDQALLEIEAKRENVQVGKTFVPGTRLTLTFSTHELRFRDNFAFWNSGAEGFWRVFASDLAGFPDFYSAGSFLQNDLLPASDRYPPVQWTMKWGEYQHFSFLIPRIIE